MQNLVHQYDWLGVLWGLGRPALFPKWVFYVDGSAPSGESCRFAYTGTLVLRAAAPSIFQRRKFDWRSTCTGGYFFWAFQLAFGLGCPAGLGKGQLQGHPSRGQSGESSVSRNREHTFYKNCLCWARSGAKHCLFWASRPPGPGPDRIGSARPGPARLGSARLGLARLGSARPAQLVSARLGWARLG